MKNFKFFFVATYFFLIVTGCGNKKTPLSPAVQITGNTGSTGSSGSTEVSGSTGAGGSAGASDSTGSSGSDGTTGNSNITYYTLTIYLTGTGKVDFTDSTGSHTCSVSGPVNGGTKSGTCTGTYAANDTATMIVTPAPSWNVGTSKAVPPSAAADTNNATSIRMTSNAAFNAQFYNTTYTLTIYLSGTGTAYFNDISGLNVCSVNGPAGGGTKTGHCTGTYNSGDTATVTLQPGPLWEITGTSKAVPPTATPDTNNATSIKMTSDAAFNAMFGKSWNPF